MVEGGNVPYRVKGGTVRGVCVRIPCQTVTVRPSTSAVDIAYLLTKLNGGLSRLHSADEDAVSWLTNYGK